MAALNVVRFRVKPGREKEFVDAHRDVKLPGIKRAWLLKTGDRSYCIVGMWRDFKSLVAARPAMIANLDKVRGCLEDLGGGLGVTDPASGEVVLAIGGGGKGGKGGKRGKGGKAKGAAVAAAGGGAQAKGRAGGRKGGKAGKRGKRGGGAGAPVAAAPVAGAAKGKGDPKLDRKARRAARKAKLAAKAAKGKPK